MGSLARRTFEATIPNEESTCLGYLRIFRSRSYADARGRRRVPSPAAVQSPYSKPNGQASGHERVFTPQKIVPKRDHSDTRTPRPESDFFNLKHEHCEPYGQASSQGCLSSGPMGRPSSASCLAASKRSDRPSRSELVTLSSCTSVSAERILPTKRTRAYITRALWSKAWCVVVTAWPPAGRSRRCYRQARSNCNRRSSGFRLPNVGVNVWWSHTAGCNWRSSGFRLPDAGVNLWRSNVVRHDGTALISRGCRRHGPGRHRGRGF